MTNISIKQLIECGVHFGHSSSRWNPKMGQFIYGKRNAIHIIDLRQTIKGLLRASNFLKALTAKGGNVLFVGTKKAAKIVVSDEANKAGLPHAAERWLGGTFTNFETIKSRVKRLEMLETIEEDGSIHNYSKKVIAKYGREKRKLNRNLGGIRSMDGIPDCMIVVDPRREKSAVAEANRMGVPVIALTDTDSDPDDVDIVIPGNDDAVRSIQYILSILVDAIKEGRSKYTGNIPSKAAESKETSTAAPAPDAAKTEKPEAVAAAKAASSPVPAPKKSNPIPSAKKSPIPTAKVAVDTNAKKGSE